MMQASNVKRLVIISLFLLSTGAVGYYIASGTKQTSETLETQASESEAPASTGWRSGLKMTMDQSTAAVVRNFEESITHDAPPIFSEPAKVLDHLSDDLREGFMYPSHAQLQQVDPSAAAEIKSLIGIYIMPVVERDDPNYGKIPPEIHVRFNDGSKNVSPTRLDPRETLLITMQVDENKLDPYREVERANSARRNGESDADVDKKVIDINGIPGYARPPGYMGLDSDKKVPRAGFVMWQQGNVVYMIRGLNREPGTQLSTLAAIARSMKPVKKN